MITISVAGLEQLQQLIEKLGSFYIVLNCVRIIERHVDRIIQSIQQDPEIPQEYKNALITWSDVERGTVYLAVYIPEELEWKKFGPYMVYGKYKCKIRHYFGGTLTYPYTARNYLMEKWSQMKDQITNSIREEIIQYIKQEVIGGLG